MSNSTGEESLFSCKETYRHEALISEMLSAAQGAFPRFREQRHVNDKGCALSVILVNPGTCSIS